MTHEEQPPMSDARLAEIRTRMEEMIQAQREQAAGAMVYGSDHRVSAWLANIGPDNGALLAEVERLRAALVDAETHSRIAAKIEMKALAELAQAREIVRAVADCTIHWGAIETDDGYTARMRVLTKWRNPDKGIPDIYEQARALLAGES